MISHFSVILLCLSGVYCISSIIENLDLNGLKFILKGQINYEEWATAMDQDIIIKNDDDSETTINVKDTVYDFGQRAETDDYNAVTEFESIHSIIKTAYQCTLMKYASITAYLIFQELWELKTNIYWAMNDEHNIPNISNIGIEELFENETWLNIYRKLKWRINVLDLDIILEKDAQEITIGPEGNDNTMPELINLWAGFIEKNIGFDISYKIFTGVMKAKFTNEYGQPFIDALNELICVLNEAIQMLDNSIKGKCVKHGGSFVKNFESLKTGVKGEFISLLTQIDEQNANDASKDGRYLKHNRVGDKTYEYLSENDLNWKLYRHFSKSFPGPLPAYHEINASGCFVEKLEFKISGFKTDLANTNNPTDMYGDNKPERTSQIYMKLIQSPETWPNKVKKGVLLFRDKKNSFNVYPKRGVSVKRVPKGAVFRKMLKDFLTKNILKSFYRVQTLQ